MRKVNFRNLMKVFVIFLSYVCIMWISSSIFANNFLYKYEKTESLNEENSTKDSYIKNQSSISTSSNTVLTLKEAEFSFQSVSQILIEPTTNVVLYENNADEKLLPASVTKIMTLLITMEHIDSGKLKYDDKITCSTKASKMGGSQIWFKENETLSVDEALKAICVVSANDVTLKFWQETKD